MCRRLVSQQGKLAPLALQWTTAERTDPLKACRYTTMLFTIHAVHCTAAMCVVLFCQPATTVVNSSQGARSPSKIRLCISIIRPALRCCQTACGLAQENANRLEAYKSKLVVFPRRSKKPKQGDSSAEELSTAQQQNSRRVLPMAEEKPEAEFVSISSELKVHTDCILQYLTLEAMHLVMNRDNDHSHSFAPCFLQCDIGNSF